MQEYYALPAVTWQRYETCNSALDVYGLLVLTESPWSRRGGQCCFKLLYHPIEAHAPCLALSYFHTITHFYSQALPIFENFALSSKQQQGNASLNHNDGSFDVGHERLLDFQRCQRSSCLEHNTGAADCERMWPIRPLPTDVY